MTELSELREKIEARIKKAEGAEIISNYDRGYAGGLKQALSLFDEHFSAEKGSKGTKA